MRRLVVLSAIVLFGVLMETLPAAEGPISYPPAKRVTQIDDYHGTKVEDPYRRLEDDVRKSPEVRAWVEAQNTVTDAYLAAIPQRDSIRKLLTGLWDYERYSAPFKVGGRYFFYKNDGLQNQSVLYVADALDAEPRVLIDPNAWSKEGTVALASLSLTDDARYAAYAVAESGSDWNVWRVLDVDIGKVMADELRWSKFSGASWTRDGKGFFYSRFPAPKEGETFQSLNTDMKLYYHRIGTPQSDDVLVYQRPDQPKWTVGGSVSEDGRYLVIRIGDGTTSRNNRVAYKDLAEPYGMPTDLIDNFDGEFSFIDNDGPVFTFKTDLDAPRGRVVAIDTRKPGKANWKVIVPEAEDTLQGAGVVGNLLVTTYLKDASTRIKIYTPSGRFVRDVLLPGLGSAGGFSGRKSDTETFYTFTSFATPPSIYHYDMITGESKLYRQAKVKGFDPEEYEVKQVFYPSKDGTKIPMFLTMKKGTKLDGNNPVLLYGYGGFNISLTPGFSVSRAAWLEMGGVFAQPNLRGGGEYGEEWHRAGTKLKKQNVFDDFIAAAEYLIKEKYTTSKKLAIQGGSNGGLLVGACMTQRPELFGACLPSVGVMDMLRFQKFTAGRFWVDDYGSSDDADEFKAIYAYSPYHNLKKGVAYPPTLVTTADTDDRVVPGHSFKFIAMLQYCQTGPNPVLARIETKAGHGAGKPTSKMIDEVADLWAFCHRNLGMTWAPGK